MSRFDKVALSVLALVTVGGFLAMAGMLRHGLSARDEPMRLEAFLARRLRHWAVPRDQRNLKNPVPVTEASLAQGRAHFADHCALCHGNDGTGQTTIGRNLYPRAPDMTSSTTQSLSDGELFFIIKNGVRLTGMPAWGAETQEDDRESWRLVQFIRHLPEITEEELEEMKEMNPKTRSELAEEEKIRKFLSGHGETAIPPEPIH